MPLKIVATGPESTGKSTLCAQLAAHFNTSWVPEYAREYLLKNGSEYHYADLLHIARGQLASEDEYARHIAPGTPLFIDTDMYVMKVWCEFVFDRCHRFILDEIASRQYHLYLLCKPDLPWEPDVLREYPDPDVRDKLYKMYRQMLLSQPVPWVEVEGGYDNRLRIAIDAVEKIIK